MVAALLLLGCASLSSDTLHVLRIVRRRAGPRLAPPGAAADAAPGGANATWGGFYLSDLLDNLGLRHSFDAEDDASIALAEDGDEEGERGVAAEEDEGKGGSGGDSEHVGAGGPPAGPVNETSIVDAPSEERAEAAAAGDEEDDAAQEEEGGAQQRSSGRDRGPAGRSPRPAAGAGARSRKPARASRRPPARERAGGSSAAAGSAAPVAATTTTAAAAVAAAGASGGGGGGGSGVNLVRDAYEAQLRRLLAAPPARRRYLRIVPLSGWGNKIRALSSGLKLALAMDRIALVDTPTMAPFYGPLFELPARPWFARDVRRLVRADTARWPHVEMRSPSKRNRAARCWVARRSLSACVDTSAQVLSYASYFHVDALIHDTPELARELQAKLGAPLPPAPAYDAASLAWLLPALSARMAAHVAAVESSLRWRDYALVVGLHMRVFVDYWRRRVSVERIAPAFWRCVRGRVAALQAARGVAPGAPNGTLVFVASDLPASRQLAVAQLQGLADVRSAPARGFVHTETKRDWGGLSLVLTDWWLLGEADLLIGTDLSTFAPTAAMRRRVPLVLTSMKPPGKGRRHKCAALVGNNLGTDS